MTAATALGLTLIAGEVALIAVVVGGLTWSLRRERRATEREWKALRDVIEAARGDIDRSAPIALLAPEVAARADEDIALWEQEVEAQ